MNGFGVLNRSNPCNEYSNEYFRVTSMNISQSPPIEIADPYSFSPRYVGGCYETCEATIECDSPMILHSLLKYLKTYDGNTEYPQSIELIKKTYEDVIDQMREENKKLLAEVMANKLTPKYKLKHRIKYIKL